MDIISTTNAPEAIGPYSQAVAVGDLLFTAGQIPLDPATMKIVEGDVAVQTERVFQNLIAILEAAGLGLDKVAKTTVYLADMADFPAMNTVYAKFFGDHKPARATVQVAGLPMGVSVEIDAIATKA